MTNVTSLRSRNLTVYEMKIINVKTKKKLRKNGNIVICIELFQLQELVFINKHVTKIVFDKSDL